LKKKKINWGKSNPTKKKKKKKKKKRKKKKKIGVNQTQQKKKKKKEIKKLGTISMGELRRMGKKGRRVKPIPFHINIGRYPPEEAVPTNSTNVPEKKKKKNTIEDGM